MLSGPTTIGMAVPSVAVVSRIIPEEAVGRWEIQDLSRLQRRSSKAYASGPILMASGSHFGLLLRLGGKDMEFANDLQVYAVNLSGKRIMGQHTIRVMNQTKGREADVVLTGEPVLWELKSEWGWKQAMSLEHLEDPESGFVVDETLVLELFMQVWDAESVRTQSAPSMLVRPFAPPGTSVSLSMDMGELLRSGRGSDIVVKGRGLHTGCSTTSGGGDFSDDVHDNPMGSSCDSSSSSSASSSPPEPEIRAHRVVLAARSPVFDRMLFTSGMRETMQDGFELYLEGADGRIADWFVKFLYTDEVSPEAWDDQEALCYLLALAHRYQVQPLVERCQARLVDQLSEESAPERLIMADMLDSPALKAAVLDYMCGSHRRLARLQASEGFGRLTKTRPQLLRDILATVVPPVVKRPRLEPAATDKQVNRQCNAA